MTCLLLQHSFLYFIDAERKAGGNINSKVHFCAQSWHFKKIITNIWKATAKNYFNFFLYFSLKISPVIRQLHFLFVHLPNMYNVYIFFFFILESTLTDAFFRSLTTIFLVNSNNLGYLVWSVTVSFQLLSLKERLWEGWGVNVQPPTLHTPLSLLCPLCKGRKFFVAGLFANPLQL